MSRGYVYVLSNPSMPGIVKIGRTQRNVEARAKELRTTGVPSEFFVEWYQLFPNCAAAEAAIHATFSEDRLFPDREFFRVDVADVITELNELIKAEVQAIIDIYFSHASLVTDEQSVSIGIIERIADRIGTSSMAVAAGCSHIDDDVIWRATEGVFVKLAQTRDSAA